MKLFGNQPRLDDCLAGRDNNLNLIRVIAAGAVLVSHAFPIALGEGAAEPLKALTGMSLGAHAVAIFFILSGLLIARSFDRGSSKVRFVMARILRLFPALIVVLILTVFAGALMTTLSFSQYFSSLETLTYVPRNLSLAFLQYPLPGLFADNPLPGAINGSLWTLFYEVVCYAGVFVVGILGVLRMRLMFTCLTLALAGAFVFSGIWVPEGGLAYRMDKLVQLGFPFALGMLAYVWRDRLLLDWRIAGLLWSLPVIFGFTILLPLVILVAVGYSLLWLGFVAKGTVLSYNRLGDYSYGIYIYAFPVQQSLALIFPGIGPYENMALAAPITILLAVLSWHLIEENALAKVKPLAAWLELRLPRFVRLGGTTS